MMTKAWMLWIATCVGCSSAGPGSMSPDGSTQDGAPPPHEVGKCDNLGQVGVWEAISPPDILPFDPSGFGTNAYLLDPLHAGTVYLGTASLGIWKSTDCGANWAHVNVGSNGHDDGCWIGNRTWAAALDSGRQWSMLIDPVDSKILYANNGFGSCTYGLLKSVDGGDNWAPIWPPVDPARRIEGVSDFIGSASMDPENRLHLIADFHSDCAAPFTGLCVIETFDGGETWRGISTDSRMGAFSAHNSHLYLLTSNVWIFGAAGSLWRTADSGATWDNVSDLPFHGGMMRAANGDFLLAGERGVYRSSNIGATWTAIDKSGSLMGNIASDGTRLYTSSFDTCAAFDQSHALQPYATSDDDGFSWAPLASPGMAQGGTVNVDRDHHVLYSSNCTGGFWRVRLQ